jgi:hypothetical protein
LIIWSRHGVSVGKCSENLCLEENSRVTRKLLEKIFNWKIESLRGPWTKTRWWRVPKWINMNCRIRAWEVQLGNIGIHVSPRHHPPHSSFFSFRPRGLFFFFPFKNIFYLKNIKFIIFKKFFSDFDAVKISKI